MENKEAGYEKQLGDSSLEDFDYAVFNWLNETLDLHAKTNKGWKKACAENTMLAKGLNIVEGRIVYKAIADSLSLPFYENAI